MLIIEYEKNNQKLSLKRVGVGLFFFPYNILTSFVINCIKFGTNVVSPSLRIF
jgi:hypothetical protein